MKGLLIKDLRIVFSRKQQLLVLLAVFALIAFTANDAGNAFWKQIGWTRKSDVNYYEFVLNEQNITRFIGEDDDDI